METVTPRIYIPPTQNNLNVVTALAAEDAEVREAMSRDTRDGRTFGGYVSQAQHQSCPRVITGGSVKNLKIDVRDSAGRRKHTEPMNDTTRNDLHLMLTAIEQRMDKRVERLERAEALRASAYRSEQEARDKLYAERFESTSRRLEDRDKVIDSKLDTMSGTIAHVNETVSGFAQHLDKNVQEVKSSNRNTLLGILAIGAATVLGLWGANSTIIGSASSIFESGAQQAVQQQESQELLRETKELLRQIQIQSAPPVSEPATKPRT